MGLILYPLYALLAIVMTLVAYIIAPILPLFVKDNGKCPDGVWEQGDLPKWLKWFQTPDASCYGADFWQYHNMLLKDKAVGKYRLALGWFLRNPAQGLDSALRANVTMQTPLRVFGNTNISDVQGIGGYYLILGGGYFHIAYVLKLPFISYCLEGGAGWRMINIVQKYEHPTMGQLVVTPPRLFKFGGGKK